jgi:hypothetical protein
MIYRKDGAQGQWQHLDEVPYPLQRLKRPRLIAYQDGKSIKLIAD